MSLGVPSAPAPTQDLSPEPAGRGAPPQTGPPRRFWRLMPMHLVLIAVCLAWIYPFAWMASTAFKPRSEVFTNGLALIPESPILDNFVRAWDSARFSQYAVNTVIVAVSVSVLVVAISSLAGYALGRGDMPGRKVIVAVLVATMFLPKGYTILPIYLLVNALGLNNTLFGIILAESGPAHIVPILLYLGYFRQVPRELEESAVIDGAGHWRIYLRIMLPLAKPVTATVFIFTFISAWNSFLVPLVFTLGAPDKRTLGVGIFTFFGENAIDWTGLAAGAVISVVPVIVVFLFMQRYFIEGIAGAIKG